MLHYKIVTRRIFSFNFQVQRLWFIGNVAVSHPMAILLEPLLKLTFSILEKHIYWNYVLFSTDQKWASKKVYMEITASNLREWKKIVFWAIYLRKKIGHLATSVPKELKILNYYDRSKIIKQTARFFKKGMSKIHPCQTRRWLREKKNLEENSQENAQTYYIHIRPPVTSFHIESSFYDWIVKNVACRYCSFNSL